MYALTAAIESSVMRFAYEQVSVNEHSGAFPFVPSLWEQVRASPAPRDNGRGSKRFRPIAVTRRHRCAARRCKSALHAGSNCKRALQLKAGD
jgi:hypothetical protein